ncbi:MAG TPA: hypothetical protein VHA07_02930 [Devosia sp.]|nr:hypothetical protein [Devosia sp.]
MLGSWRNIAAGVALIAALALPVAVLAQGVPTLTINAQAGFFTGKWIYRSFAVSANPKDTLAKLAYGINELNLVEQGGRVSGQRLGQGVSYDLSGNTFYAAKQGATIRLHGTATIGGKAYNYDYFGYVVPTWTGIGSQPDTILGTVLRSDPANPTNAPLIASFSATREAAK